MKPNGLFVHSLSFLMTALIPIGVNLQLFLKDVPVVRYLTLFTGKLLYYLGGLPFFVTNSIFIRSFHVNLYELPVVGGVIMMVAVSFCIWWIVFLVLCGRGGEKVKKRNVRFI